MPGRKLTIGGAKLKSHQHTVCWIKGDDGSLGVMDAAFGSVWEYDKVENAANLVKRGMATASEGSTPGSSPRRSRNAER